MKTSTLLKRLSMDPDEPVLLITAEEAMENLLEAIEKYCPNLEINKMTNEDIKALLESYGRCVINYHPEKNHQERAALLYNFKILQQYGITSDDHDYLDFY
jgi:hypothetical protein